MRKIKVGIIGVGNWGMNHLRVYSELREAKVVSVADKDLRKLETASKLYGVETYLDPEEMLEKEEIEAVSIVTPTNTHGDLASLALKHGKHVLVEKPFATDLKEAKGIVNEANKRGLLLAVGHIMRFNPGVNKIKELVENKVIGKVIVLSFKRLGMVFTKISDIGVVKDLAIHDIDLIRYILNKNPVEVYAYVGRVKHLNEDYAASLMKIEEGLYCFVETNWLSPSKVREITITGDKGILHFNDSTRELKVEKYTREGRKEIYPFLIWREPLKEELRHFLRCIKGEERLRTTGTDGLIAIYIAEKILESAKKGKVVKLNYNFT